VPRQRRVHAARRRHPRRGVLGGNVAKWIDKPGLSAGQLADGDKVLIGDVSEAVGSRDKTVTLGDLRTFLGAGVTVGVTQASHGLSVGDVVRHNGTSYVKATADTGVNAQAVGI